MISNHLVASVLAEIHILLSFRRNTGLTQNLSFKDFAEGIGFHCRIVFSRSILLFNIRINLKLIYFVLCPTEEKNFLLMLLFNHIYVNFRISVVNSELMNEQ